MPDASPNPTAHRRPALRLAIILAIGLGLAGMVLGLKYFWFARPVGSGPAGLAVPRASFQTVWDSGEVMLLGLGDSITAGFGATRGHSYFDRLVSNPADEFPDMEGISLAAVFPNLVPRNLAVSGSTSLQHAAEQVPQLAAGFPSGPAIVVMTSGGNDIIHDYGRSTPQEGAMFGATLAKAQPWIAAFEQRLGGMLDQIQAAFPQGCHVFLADIYDPTDGVGDVHRAGLPAWPDGAAILAAYNEIIARCAGERSFVHLVDIHSEFLGHGIHCTQIWRSNYRWSDPHYWFFENLEDPNDRGYDAIRRLFLLKMAEVLGP